MLKRNKKLLFWHIRVIIDDDLDLRELMHEMSAIIHYILLLFYNMMIK